MKTLSGFSKGEHITNYVITYIAYAMGGIMFFYLKPLPKIIFFAILFILMRKRKKTISEEFIVVISLITIIFIVQKLQFGYGDIYNYSSFIIIFGIGYFLVKILGFRLPYYFVNVVYFFSIISLIFWLLSNISNGFYDFTSNIAFDLGTDESITNESFIMYAYEPNRSLFDLTRNNGGFWEPGVYATWLSIALLYNVIHKSFSDKKSKVILITLVTTFSTAGYVALFLIIIFYLNKKTISPKAQILLKYTILVLVIFSVVYLDFLGPKLVERYNFESSVSLSTPTAGRFLSARKSLYAISQNPVFGKGLAQERDENPDYTRLDVGNYGIMNMIQRIGIIASIFFLYYIYKYYKIYLIRSHFNKSDVMYCFLVWLVLMFSQTLFWAPVSIYIFFLPVVYDFNKKLIT